MVKSYAKLGDFEVRDIVYLGGYKDTTESAKRLDVVKWETHSPMEVVNAKTGKKEISTRCCYSIGTLEWDDDERWWDFKSCGLRFLEDANTIVCRWLEEFAKQYARDNFGVEVE